MFGQGCTLVGVVAVLKAVMLFNFVIAFSGHFVKAKDVKGAEGCAYVGCESSN
jgi:hypothetical protein